MCNSSINLSDIVSLTYRMYLYINQILITVVTEIRLMCLVKMFVGLSFNVDTCTRDMCYLFLFLCMYER